VVYNLCPESTSLFFLGCCIPEMIIVIRPTYPNNDNNNIFFRGCYFHDGRKKRKEKNKRILAGHVTSPTISSGKCLIKSSHPLSLKKGGEINLKKKKIK
jgi:hypothetical protein